MGPQGPPQEETLVGLLHQSGSPPYTLESTWCWLQPAAVQELAFALQSFAFLFAFLKAQGIYHLWQRWFSDLQGRSKPSPVIFCLVYQRDFYKGPPRATEDCSLGADATSLPAAGTGGHSLAKRAAAACPQDPCHSSVAAWLSYSCETRDLSIRTWASLKITEVLVHSFGFSTAWAASL